MKQFVIETPHTKEECLAELDGIAAKNPALLEKFRWGCKVGEHTGYATVEADNERAARDLVPQNVRAKARIHEVDRFTQADIRAAHQMRP